MCAQEGERHLARGQHRGSRPVPRRYQRQRRGIAIEFDQRRFTEDAEPGEDGGEILAVVSLDAARAGERIGGDEAARQQSLRQIRHIPGRHNRRFHVLPPILRTLASLRAIPL